MKNIYYLTTSYKRLCVLQEFLKPYGYTVYPYAKQKQRELWQKELKIIKELTLKTTFYNTEDVDMEIRRMDFKHIYEPKLFETRKIFERVQPDVYIIDYRLTRVGYLGQHFYSCIRRAYYEYPVPTNESKDPVIYLKQFPYDPLPCYHRKMKCITFDYCETLPQFGGKILKSLNKLLKIHTIWHRLLHAN